MSVDKSIETAIQKLAGTYLKDLVSIILCTVASVDKPNRQCDCTPIGGDATTDLPGVLLCAENNNGLVVLPVVGSTVIVALSTRNTAFVLMYSDVDSIQFMDGSLGGMVKLLDPAMPGAGILAHMNAIENKLNDFISKWNAFCVAYVPGSPSVTGLPATLTSSEETPVPITAQSDLENTLIKQGINP